MRHMGKVLRASNEKTADERMHDNKANERVNFLCRQIDTLYTLTLN